MSNTILNPYKITDDNVLADELASFDYVPPQFAVPGLDEVLGDADNEAEQMLRIYQLKSRDEAALEDKFNPHHDRLGRFTSGGAGAPAAGADVMPDGMMNGADKWVRAHYADLPDKLTPEESGAVAYYVESGYHSLNESFRDGTAAGYMQHDKYFAAQVNALDSAISKSEAPSDMLAYRGVSEKVYKRLEKTEGKTFTAKGYTSVSYNEDMAANFPANEGAGQVIQVRIPKGAHALFADIVVPDRVRDEQEFVLPRGAKFDTSRNSEGVLVLSMQAGKSVAIEIESTLGPTNKRPIRHFTWTDEDELDFEGEKFNPHHDQLGRFASGSGLATAPASATPEAVAEERKPVGNVAAENMLEQRYPHMKADFEGVDPDLADVVANTIDGLMTRYPDAGKTLMYVGTGVNEKKRPPYLKAKNDAYATTFTMDVEEGTPRSFMLLNPKVWENKKLLIEWLEGDQKAGWHVRNSGDAQAVIEHEFGHVVNLHLECAGADKAFMDYTLGPNFGVIGSTVSTWALSHTSMGKSVSRYAAEGGRYEQFAEGFQDIIRNPKPERAKYSNRLDDLLKTVYKDGTTSNWRDRFQSAYSLPTGQQRDTVIEQLRNEYDRLMKENTPTLAPPITFWQEELDYIEMTPERVAFLTEEDEGAKFNPHHDQLGRFASGSASGGSLVGKWAEDIAPVLTKRQGPALHSLSQKEYDAVDLYTGAERGAVADRVNGWLRKPEQTMLTADELEEVRTVSDGLSSAIAKVTVPEMTLWRGAKEGLEAYSVGSSYTDAGFGSTAYDQSRAMDYIVSATNGYLLKIHVPEGTHALSVGAFRDDGDEEMILDKGTTYQTRSITHKDPQDFMSRTIVEVDVAAQKFNRNHDRLGRFAHGGAGGALSTPGRDEARKLERHLEEKHPDLKVDFTDVDPDLAADVADEVDKLIADYPAAGRQLTYIGTGTDPKKTPKTFDPATGYTYAQRCTNYRETLQGGDQLKSYIALNRNLWGNKSILQELLKEDVAHNYHPKGTGTPKALLDHEYAHVIGAHLASAPSDVAFRSVVASDGLGRVRQTLQIWSGNHILSGQQVSKYAAKEGPAEAFADGFAEMRNNPQAKWSTHAKAVNRLLDTVYLNGSSAGWTNDTHLPSNDTERRQLEGLRSDMTKEAQATIDLTDPLAWNETSGYFEQTPERDAEYGEAKYNPHHDNLGRFASGTAGHSGQTAPLSTEQIEAVRYYCEFGWNKINKKLRQKKALGDEDKKAVKAIRSALRPTVEDMTVYRGVHDYGVREKLTNNVGGTVKDRGFLSTTTDEEAARYTYANATWGAVLAIKVPKGTLALSTEGISQYGEEKELLIHDNTTSHIAGTRVVDGMQYIDMEIAS